MSHQVQLDDGMSLSIYCGPLLPNKAERRRIGVHAKSGERIADYPLVPSDRLSAARERAIKALEGLGMEDEADGGRWHLIFGCDSVSYGNHQCPSSCEAARDALQELKQAEGGG